MNKNYNKVKRVCNTYPPAIWLALGPNLSMKSPMGNLAAQRNTRSTAKTKLNLLLWSEHIPTEELTSFEPVWFNDELLLLLLAPIAPIWSLLQRLWKNPSRWNTSSIDAHLYAMPDRSKILTMAHKKIYNLEGRSISMLIENHYW